MAEFRSRLQSRVTHSLPYHWGPAVKKGMWGLGDHALMSITNFGTTVLVARVVSPAEFGFYSLAYTWLLFTNSIQSALIIQPHTVLGATRSDDEYVRYTTGTAWSQLTLATLTMLVTLIFALVGLAKDWSTVPMLLALAPASAAWQLQDFVRRAQYTRIRIAGAFANDLVAYGLQLVVVIMLWRAGNLTPGSAILTLAITSFMGFAIGMWQIRAHLDWNLSLAPLKENIRLNWEFGKWLLGGNLALWTSGQVYPILAAGFVSLNATGALKAAQTILGPTNIFIIALDPLFGPKASRVYSNEGIHALRSFLSTIHLMIIGFMGTYCLAVVIFARQIIEFVYGPEYAAFTWVLILVSLLTLVSSLRTPIKLGLRTLGENHAIFRIYLASSSVNLSLGLIFVQQFGLRGVAFGLILNTVVIQAMTWHFQNRFLGSAPLLPRHLDRSITTADTTPRQRHA